MVAKATDHPIGIIIATGLKITSEQISNIEWMKTFFKKTEHVGIDPNTKEVQLPH